MNPSCSTPTRPGPAPLLVWLESLDAFQDRFRELSGDGPPSESELLQLLLTEVDQLLPGAQAGLYLVDPETLDFDLRLVNTLAARSELERVGAAQIRDGMFIWALRSGRPAVVDAAAADTRASAIILPLLTAKTVVGVCLLLWPASRKDLDQEQLTLLSTLGSQLSFVVENIRLFHRLEEQNRALEGALQAARLKSELLASMSHEIRTPMTGVCGMTDLLLATNLTPEQREFTESVGRSADALLTIINDVLDFSKIEAGKLTLVTSDFDLIRVVEDATFVPAPRAAAKGLEIACVVDPAVPRAVRGDSGRLRQILINLLGNAVKFTDRGEVVLRVSVAEQTERQITVHFSVSDTGCGMAPDLMHRLFQEFSQLEGSETRGEQGTGLGLAISKRLSEMMGGEIGVESLLGRGSTFRFTARLAPSTDPPYADPPCAALRDARVLTVDHHGPTREAIRNRLVALGARSEVAATPEDALARLHGAVRDGDPYRFVLVDMDLPAIDGQTLGRAIRADRALDGCTMVLLSSLGHLADPHDKTSLFSARLPKPVSSAQLASCLGALHAEAAGWGNVESFAASSPAAEPPSHTPRVLLVEDNRVNQVVARFMLENTGTRVEIANDGREALAALARGRFDLILMDIQMPQLDGFKTTAEIRQRYGIAQHVPIVAMTAHAMPGDRERCLAAGMDDYVPKPIKQADLEAVLRRWISQRVARTPAAGDGDCPPGASRRDVLDRDAALDQTGGNIELLLNIVQVFQQTTVTALEEIRTGLAHRDTGAVEDAAHKLKGALGALAAPAAQEAAGRLETLGRRGNLTQADQALAALEHELTRLDAEFDALAKQLPAGAGT